jgi:hypothetical protein
LIVKSAMLCPHFFWIVLTLNKFYQLILVLPKLKEFDPIALHHFGRFNKTTRATSILLQTERQMIFIFINFERRIKNISQL